jgi:ribonuclease Y
MLIALVVLVAVAVATSVASRQLARHAAERGRRTIVSDARWAAHHQLQRARAAVRAQRRAEENQCRSELVAESSRLDEELSSTSRHLDQREDRLTRVDNDIAMTVSEMMSRSDSLDEDHRQWTKLREQSGELRRRAEELTRERAAHLEASARVTAEELTGSMRQTWLDDAQARIAARMRAVVEHAADPAYDREARRVLEISSSRYQNHFLTERNQSNLPVGAPIVELLQGDGGVLHAALEQVAGVKLLFNDSGESIRLDGLDGVGREVARRALGKLLKKPESAADAKAAPVEWCTRFREVLDGEIRALGKKAFQILEIPRPHGEIVELVGALNYRTSYTQNQWLHAVEASFLAGMMAAELGLDQKLARRATLMHDIGKALTHKIEGSHAVIGADIARRLGESELVANAIGSHHGDEPANSVFAYLVAASDAMSGARPGARREMAEGFSGRVDDLERIGTSRRGIDRAHAVHGGRELRVYVREQDVDDLGVVTLSTDIAAQISEEMTFPGQIKVTVIRSFEATSVAN